MLELPENTQTICCTQCSHQAIWPFQFDRHIQRNHRNVHANKLFHAVTEPEPYACLYCSSKSYCKLYSYEHFKNKHDAARSGNSIEETDQINDNFEPYHSQCSFCKYKCHSIVSIVKHHDLCEMADAPSEMEFINVPHQFDLLTDSLKCSYKEKFDLKRHKNKHATAKAISKRFKCTECSFWTKTENYLERHMLNKHVLPKTQQSKEIPWLSCAKCSYRTKEKDVLKTHMLTHANTKWFYCAHCSYRATHKSNAKRHMLTHVTADQIQWFNCTKCSFQAKFKWNLKSHMLTHVASDEVNWFKCTKCSYKAKYKGDVNRHIVRTHTGSDKITVYTCDVCSHQFKHKGSLMKHLLTHQDSINRLCSYRCELKSNLDHHMLIHSTDDVKL